MSLCDMRELIKDNLAFGVSLLGISRGEILGYDFVNNKGYIVELDLDGDIQLLFIADEKDFIWLHEAGSVFVNKTFKNRCRWVSHHRVKYSKAVGLLI